MKNFRLNDPQENAGETSKKNAYLNSLFRKNKEQGIKEGMEDEKINHSNVSINDNSVEYQRI